MTVEVPEGWSFLPLKKISKEIKNKWEPNDEEDHHYVGLEHIEQGTGKLIALASSQGLSSAKSCFSEEDILFGKLRPNLRKTAFPKVSGICSTDILVIRPNKTTYPDFLHYLLASEPMVAHSINTAAGTKMPRTSWKLLSEFQVYVPPLPEQKKIAEVLSSVDEAIAATKAVIDQTKQVKKGLLQTLLTKGIGHTTFKQTPLGEIPESWEVKTVDEICSKVTVGIASSATHAYTVEGVPMLRNQNIMDGYIKSDDLLYVTEAYHKENRTKAIKAGDVITMRTGYPGRSAVVPKEYDDCQTFTTLVSRPKQEIILPSFLATWINSDQGMKFVKARQAGGAQQNLNAGVLKTIPVAIPQIEVQQKIVKNIAQVDDLRVSNEKQLAQLQTLKSGLMSDLLTGRKRVEV